VAHTRHDTRRIQFTGPTNGKFLQLLEAFALSAFSWLGQWASCE
jgi:hypothetical protein